MTGQNLKCRRIGMVLGLMLLISGCTTPPNPGETVGSASITAADVHFLHQAPPNARFIAKIPYSSGSSEDWRLNCVMYLAQKAAKLGGNVVVPGVELDYGGTDKLQPGDPRFNPTQPPTFIRTVNENGQIVTQPGRFHFWSAVYFCPQ